MRSADNSYRPYHHANRAFGLTTVGIAVLTLIGWSLHSQAFTSIPPFTPLEITAAIGFLCTAASVLALNTTRSETGPP